MTKMKDVSYGGVVTSNDRPLTVIAGPCQIESADHAQMIAGVMAEACKAVGAQYVFKASYDKANRTSLKGKRGLGIDAGLRVLGDLKARMGLPVLTDIHDPEQARIAAQVVDVIQIPAFLCRQTDLIHAAVCTGAIVNVKKGQFLAPGDMGNVVQKAVEAAPDGKPRLLLTERGTTFGYQNLVSDMRSLPILGRMGYPVVFDATHSVQLPGGAGDHSGGQREFAPVLARCAVVAGANGLFIETHPDPAHALSDGPNMVPLADMRKLLAQLVRLKEAL